MHQIKSEIKAVIEAVRDGEQGRGVGAVVFQGYNTLLRAIEVERRVAEADEYQRRIEDLKRRIRSHAG
jgi:uncharacterized protein YwlG (UPF0340 family)